MSDKRQREGFPVFANELESLLSMQQELDESINLEHRGAKDAYVEKWRVEMALLDEIGEVIHALKGDWCYWKKTQPPVDRDLVLEELADCLHFVLSLENRHIHAPYHNREFEIKDLKHRIRVVRVKDLNIASLFQCFALYGTLNWLLDVNQRLGFTEEELIQAYYAKHEKNHERLESGY